MWIVINHLGDGHTYIPTSWTKQYQETRHIPVKRYNLGTTKYQSYELMFGLLPIISKGYWTRGCNAGHRRNVLLCFGAHCSRLYNALIVIMQSLLNTVTPWVEIRALFASQISALDKCPGVCSIGDIRDTSMYSWWDYFLLLELI